MLIQDTIRFSDGWIGIRFVLQEAVINKKILLGVIVSDDGQAAVWAGVIDDLWKMGKPVGRGGPWKNENATAGDPSDPYLIGFYDRKMVTLEHDSPEDVQFTLEVEPLGHGPWMVYKKFTVNPGKKLEYIFPEGFQARWIRLRTDKNCKASSWFVKVHF